MNQNNFWETLERIANILQIASYQLLLEDASNNDLMQELQNQDIVLANQTEKYLKSIEFKLDKILELLEEGEPNNGN